MTTAALLLAIFALGSTSAWAAKKDKAPAPTAAQEETPPGPTPEERLAVFGEYENQRAAGQKARAADALVVILDDTTKSVFHSEAYANLGQLLMELDLPYGALVSYAKSLELATDGGGPVQVNNAFTLADRVGDPEILEPIFAGNVGGQVDKMVRSRMAYLAAKENYRKKNFNVALTLLKLVVTDSPWYPDAKMLEGVVLNQQGKPQAALAAFQTAGALITKAKKDDRFENAINMNIARSYFAAENFPRAIEFYAKVDRESEYWLEAQFERSWSHFRIDDMNGALGLLHSIHSPFAEDFFYPEAELLRTYSLFLICKFPEASLQVDRFRERYQTIRTDLKAVLAKDDTQLFNDVASSIEQDRSDIRTMFIRNYQTESRFNDSLNAVRHAEDELKRLRNVAANPFSARAAEWVELRRVQIVATEGKRIRARFEGQLEDVERMLADAEMSKLDMLQMETRLYEQAAITGKLADTERIVQRKEKPRQGYVFWPWEGEWWADELGYYRVKAIPECPVGLRAAGEPPKK